jgi:hypothetical protein
MTHEGASDAGGTAPAYGNARETPNPYGTLIAKEVDRAESDLVAVRARAISVLSTVAGVVTLITGAVTFGASKSETEGGIPDAAIGLLGVGLLLIVLAAGLAIGVQAPRLVQKPLVDDLLTKTTLNGWSDGEDSFERERIVADVMVAYLDSLRLAVDDFSTRLKRSVRLLTGGLAFVAFSAVWTAASI